MEAQDLHPAAALDEHDHMSGVTPTASITNSGPEVDVRLSLSAVMRDSADIIIEQR
jgi:hypothetical protein